MCRGWLAVFNVVVRVSLIEKGTSEQRTEADKRVSQACTWGESIMQRDQLVQEL